MKTHTSQTRATQVAVVTSLARATSRAAQKAAFLLFSVAVLVAGGAAVVRGQSALDGFDPNANGTVRVAVVQPDGKILAGGSFNGANGIGGQTRNHIARLDATTGMADSFDPNTGSSDFNESVYSIAVQPDGKVLAVGGFIAIGRQMRSHIARLDATTGTTDSFDPNTSGGVWTVALQADGKILAGGNFGMIGGRIRNDIARFDPTSGLADSFNPNADFTVSSISVQADGEILCGRAVRQHRRTAARTLRSVE